MDLCVCYILFDCNHPVCQIWLSDSRSLVRNMTRSQPRFLLSGLHSTQPVDLQVYAWNRKGRGEAVTVVQRVIITSDHGSQSTGETITFIYINNQTKQLCAELPPSIVMKEPLFFVIGGAVLGFLLITLLSLIWYLKRRVSQSDGHINTRAWLLSVKYKQRCVPTCILCFSERLFSFHFLLVSW